MATFKLSGKVRKFEQNIQIFTTSRMVRIINEAARTTRDYMVQRFMGGARTSPNRLARNTGNMEKKTIVRRASQTATATKASIVIGVKYASVHFGEGGKTSTTIRPVNAQALAVPLKTVLGPDHRPVYPAKSKSITNKFSFGGILYGRLPGQKTQPLFALRSSVTVPVRVNVERDIQPFATKTVNDTVRREAAKLFGDQS